MIYLALFWAFFQIGLFSFGGGYAALPLIQNQVVDIYGWLNMTEFTDVITISQMTPGPIAINASTFVGMRVAGIWGAIISTVGCILPACVIVLSLAVFYKKYKELEIVQGILGGLRPAVVGMIASAGFAIVTNSIWHLAVTSYRIDNMDYVAIALIVLCITVLRTLKPHPIFVMLSAGVVGGLIYSFI